MSPPAVADCCKIHPTCKSSPSGERARKVTARPKVSTEFSPNSPFPPKSRARSESATGFPAGIPPTTRAVTASSPQPSASTGPRARRFTAPCPAEMSARRSADFPLVRFSQSKPCIRSQAMPCFSSITAIDCAVSKVGRLRGSQHRFTRAMPPSQRRDTFGNRRRLW